MAGDHVPVIGEALVLEIGSVGMFAPEQNGPSCVKVGIICALMVIFNDPTQPEMVYVIVAAPENVALGVKTPPAVMAPAPVGVTAHAPPAAPPLCV